MRHLLWTGGWDSTFRLLQSSLIDQVPVQPHYIIDPDRPSSTIEIDTMDRIRTAAAGKRAAQIHQPIHVRLPDVEVDSNIAASYERLRAQAHLGRQNIWLASYAKSVGIVLEVAAHRDDGARQFVHRFIEGGTVAPDKVDDPDLLMFRYFRYPILEMTKVGMGEVAEAHGFADIMAMTWFCHTPRRGEPCGQCNPCRFTIREGLGHRIPRRNRLRARAKQAIRKMIRR